MKQLHRLQMNNIEKSFSGVPSLKRVSFEVHGGEIHALLGANGAGKSTLMKILSGAYTKDQGEIVINGEKVEISSPQHAKQYGIQTVYQEVDTALIPYLNVAENILLDQQASGQGSFFLNWKRIYAQAQSLLAEVGVSIPVRKKVGELSLSEKQMVLITRAIAQKAKFVIFDEPTAPLSNTESKQLYQIMFKLKEEGVGVIFISHRLPEIFQICDRLTVLRDGEHVLTSAIRETTMQNVIAAMLGKQLKEEFPKEKVSLGKTLLEVKGLADGRKVKGVNLRLAEGEIVGIFGLVGAGKTETTRLLFAADSYQQGEIDLAGKRVRFSSPQEAIDHGLVLVPEERRKEGILVEESVQYNLSLATLKKWTSAGFIQKRAEREQASQMVKSLGVKASSLEQKVGFLSGGNQQKVAIGKWLLTDAKVYLFDEPTKGVDVGAKKEIYQLIGNLVKQGKGILYFSCEISEILGIADRIMIMYEGRTIKELQREEATQEKLMFYASGGEEDVSI